MKLINDIKSPSHSETTFLLATKISQTLVPDSLSRYRTQLPTILKHLGVCQPYSQEHTHCGLPPYHARLRNKRRPESQITYRKRQIKMGSSSSNSSSGAQQNQGSSGSSQGQNKDPKKNPYPLPYAPFPYPLPKGAGGSSGQGQSGSGGSGDKKP